MRAGPRSAGRLASVHGVVDGWLIHSPSASSIATSMLVPSPVRSRSYSAVSTPLKAYIPAAMSATEIPTLAASALYR